MSIIKSLKFSIDKRLRFIRQSRTWAKYGDETRYHLTDTRYDIGAHTYGIPIVCQYNPESKLTIGKYCSIANDVRILLGGEHGISCVSQFPFTRRKDIFPNSTSQEEISDVVIGNDVWIGRGAIILSGVTIGDGAVIGAGAIVSKDVPPYAVAVGNPIRILRYRVEKEQIEQLLKLRWWDFSETIINELIPYMGEVNNFISKCYERGGVHCNIRLSIIIVSYNTKQITDECLASIYKAQWRDSFEIIVVDNNSNDGSVEMIKSKYPEVRLIENKENRLFAIANNQGAQIAKGKYLLLLNSDTLVDGDNLQRMVDYFETCKDNVCCIGPKILNRDGSLQSHGHPDSGSLMQHIATIFHLNRLFPLHWFCKPLTRNPNVTHRTGWVSGACMMIRKCVYDEIGGLNESLEFYGEEPEFGYRSLKNGYKTIYFHNASIIHLGGVSTNKKIDEEQRFQNAVRRYEKLVKATIGYRRVITVTWWTRLSFKLKRLISRNNAYFEPRIKHETRVIEWFKERLDANQ